MRLIDAEALFETLVTGDIRETHQFCYPCKKVLEAIDAQPTCTEAEFQKMLNLVQAKFEKMYQLGYEEGKKAAQPQPQWIPVTERLPEQTGKYLVSVKNGNVYAGTYDSYGRKFQCAAVAWMSLPEPYEE